ncbi:MAG: malate dehydrogenase [Chloroflexi bacterium]|nr:malate dehydrogenase [Chloroflexota bacterium]MBM4451499.1 malate dehydrogenase [Chloroflexota bacterium]MBM4454682.1 malate dehydrogenase [Chloroflexota bacterium]
MRSKVSVIGAGNVGATLAHVLAQKGFIDVVLVDIIEGMPQGKGLDMLQTGPITGSDAKVVGTNSYEDTANSEIVVITSGVPRKPGMSRDDLVLTNMNIVKQVTEQVAKYSPKSIIILVANPLDAMTQLALHVSKFPRQRVFGQSGILDTARFRTFIAQELNVSVEDVQACILGGHGDTMVAIPRLATVGGVPLTELLPQDKINQLVDRAVKGGAEIVALLKTGSAFYAPATATAQMVESILLDKKRILPCATCLDGEYGIKGAVVGVPVKLGKSGIEQIIELKLTAEESAALKKSAEAVRELVKVMKLE